MYLRIMVITQSSDGCYKSIKEDLEKMYIWKTQTRLWEKSGNPLDFIYRVMFWEQSLRRKVNDMTLQQSKKKKTYIKAGEKRRNILKKKKKREREREKRFINKRNTASRLLH